MTSVDFEYGAHGIDTTLSKQAERQLQIAPVMNGRSRRNDKAAAPLFWKLMQLNSEISRIQSNMSPQLSAA